MWQIIKFNLSKREFYVSLIKKFLSVFGAITVILGPVVIYFPEFVPASLEGMLSHILIALGIAFIWAVPKSTYSVHLPSTNNCTITIKVDDLFHSKGHLVIGINDTFDTEIGELIKQKSVQGQFLSKVYHGDIQRLDRDIEEQLIKKKLQPTIDTSKNKGKNKRYPIGTTLSLGNGTERYFLSAYSYMGNDLKAKSSINDLWISLREIWNEVRLKGQGTKVSMPIVGSELARISADRSLLVKLIALSYVLNSKEEVICEELEIIIRKQDLKYINLIDIQNSLSSLSR